MPRHYLLYLDDMLKSIDKILKYTAGHSLETVIADEMCFDAVIRNFEIIGEAANRIPGDIQSLYTSVEWRKIADFRNVLAHEYFGIDNVILWDVISNKLPVLRTAIKEIIAGQNI